MRVLIVEDEQRLAQNLAKALYKSAGFVVDVASDGAQGLHLASSEGFDAIILDLMLPRLSGQALLATLREAGGKTPVLVLTANEEKASVVGLLDSGADDYLAKPFDLGELLARVKALIRRSKGQASSSLALGDLVLNMNTRSVSRSGSRIDVITSLPNANIADAVGRLPGVTLERDEGEGKYVQIRGTEPRLSNLTIDGVEVPSPEGGVRQVKLDTIPADLVDSVQINKTLQANQPADAIGGSVNLVTKTAGSLPTVSLFSDGGFTPIVNTVPVYDFGGTLGKRFGADKRLGALIGGEYDYNGRGIDDLESVPTILPGTAFTPAFTFLDLRQYIYDRSRYGLGGSADYKLGQGSVVYAKGLFSDFKDFGHRYDYGLATDASATSTFTTERRLGDYQIGFLVLGGNHTFTKSYLTWQASVARSRMRNPINGGESITSFNYNQPSSNCLYAPALTKSKYRPQFTSDCYTELYNPDNLSLAQISDAAHGKAAQLNLEGDVSAGRLYHIGSTSGAFEFGARVRNAHKFDNSYEIDYIPNGNVLATPFVNGFKNNNYYDGSYKYGPGVSWEAINAYEKANPGQFTIGGTAPPVGGGNSNNFDLVERISAGYLMNTLDFNRFHLIAGLRFEGTQLHTASFDANAGTFTLKGSNSYLDALPSVSLTYRLDSSSDIRAAYGRRVSRPDPQFLTAATNLDSSTVPPTLTIGNPALKSEHANNYDVLYERYLNPLGDIQAGFFYKGLSNPIVNVVAQQIVQPYGLVILNQAQNAGSAYIAGVEFNFDQHFTYLPGFLSGLGLPANYSYATSQATNVNPGQRSDKPALLRQAPSTFNISPTYDRGPLSIRVGMSYNGANIFQYQYVDGNIGGLHGPLGDIYLFSHFQVDTQGSYRLGRGFSAVISGLNLNNEPFGFYNGSSQFMIQREYYKPTYTFGLRWDHNRQ